MPTASLSCPHCGAVLRPVRPASVGQKVRCPSCQTVFVAGPAGNDQPARGTSERSADRSPRQRDAEYARRSRTPRDDDDEEDEADFRPRRRRSPQRARTDSGLVFGLAIGGVAILLLAGSVTAYLFVSHQARHPGQVADPNTDEGRAQLIEDLSSTDFGIRHQALDQLAQVAKLPPDRAPVARTLERLVHDQNPFICESAIKALTIWGDQDSVLVLIGVLNADNPFVREKAMEALAKMKDPRAVKPLVALLREMSTRHGACEALKAFGPIAEKDVAARLQSTESFERQAACEISQEIGTERSIPALEAIVNDSDRHANFFAVSAARDALAAIRARSRKR